MSYDVVIIIGSESDRPKVEASKMCELLTSSCVTWELRVISAHRQLKLLTQAVTEYVEIGTDRFICAAGMAAALPGATKAIAGDRATVIGVALSSPAMSAQDALFSIVGMPKGVPVLCAGFDEPGLYNAAQEVCDSLTRERKKLKGEQS